MLHPQAGVGGNPADRTANPSRRRLLRATGVTGAAAASATALSGCGTVFGQALTGNAPPPSQLSFWNPFTGGDGARMVDMENAYRREHPNVDLESTTLVWGNPYYTKLKLATLGDRPPQVAIAHLSKLPSLVSGGLLREISTSERKRHGLLSDHFDERAWRKSHQDGAVYAVPLDTHPFVLFYRTDIARKAGLLRDDGSLVDVDGPEAFLDAMRAAKQVTGEWGGSIATVKDPATCFRLFWSLYRQLGARLIEDGGTRVIVDMSAAEEALAYCRRMTAEKLIPEVASGKGSITLLTAGHAGFLMDGEWQLLTMRGAGIPFDMRPFPRIFRDAPYACHADSHAFVLPEAPSTDAQRVDLSLGFVRAMLDASLKWAGSGHIPAWLPTQRSDAYQRMEPQSHYASAADGAAYDPSAWYAGAGSTLTERLGSVISSVLAGRTKPRDGATRIREETRQLAEIPPPI